jgi:hypothetical protein
MESGRRPPPPVGAPKQKSSKAVGNKKSARSLSGSDLSSIPSEIEASAVELAPPEQSAEAHLSGLSTLTSKQLHNHLKRQRKKSRKEAERVAFAAVEVLIQRYGGQVRRTDSHQQSVSSVSVAPASTLPVSAVSESKSVDNPSESVLHQILNTLRRPETMSPTGAAADVSTRVSTAASPSISHPQHTAYRAWPSISESDLKLAVQAEVARTYQSLNLQQLNKRCKSSLPLSSLPVVSDCAGNQAQNQNLDQSVLNLAQSFAAFLKSSVSAQSVANGQRL